MSKVYGTKSDFAYVKQDASRTIIGYGLKEVDETHCTWYEIYFYKKQVSTPTLEQIKSAIFQDINETVRTKIIEDFEWHGHKVWLSTENQQDYQNAFVVAVQTNGVNLPIMFKFGTDDDPDYYAFNEVTALKEFWIDCSKYIEDTLQDGRKEKDEIDWSKYENM